MGGVTRLLLLLWAAVTVSSAVDLQRRIIRGGYCGGDHFYHVKFIHQYNGLRCGGSLISNQWILTAAHCWQWGMRAVVNVYPGPGHTEFIRAPPVIYADNNNWMHDIMLLKLPNPLEGQVHLAQLPHDQDCNNRPNPGVSVSIAGFGATRVREDGSRDNDVPEELRCGYIYVVDCENYRNNKLNEPGSQFFRQVNGHNHWICAQDPADYEGRADIAPGDSGGGVEHNGKIHGVISATGNDVYPYVEPALFMDVCEYRQWIRDTTGHNTPSELQCGNIPLLSAQDCTNIKNDWKKCRNPETQSKGHQDFFCYSPSPVTTQPGDSGGGVVHNGKLYGVHVWGHNASLACYYPSYAMNLCNNDYRKWINDTIYG